MSMGMNWKDVLAPCPISVVPYIVLTGKVSEDAKDKVMDVLRRHHIPFILLGDVLVSCRFAIIFERTMRYAGDTTITTNHVIIHIDPPRDRVREAIEFIFNILRESGFEINKSVDEAVEEYNRVVKAFTC
jgi:ketopantoate reductase